MKIERVPNHGCAALGRGRMRLQSLTWELMSMSMMVESFHHHARLDGVLERAHESMEMKKWMSSFNVVGCVPNAMSLNDVRCTVCY